MDDSRRTQLAKTAVPFLACLFGCSEDDAWLQPVTWQTFSDKKAQVGKDPLAKVFHGTLDENAAEIEKLNAAGAGIFVTVNGTDGQGRKKANVTQGRAWWADLDAKDAALPFDVQTILDSVPLEPSMVVKTPGGLHLYWITWDPIPFPDGPRRVEHESEVKAIAAALKPFGGDLNACTVERVLRVPGYLHKKAAPRLVELLKVDGPRYRRDEVRQAFPPVETESKPLRVARPALPVSLDRAKVLERAGRYLDTLPAGIQGQDGSGTTFNAALKIMDGFDLTEDEALSLLLDRFNPRCVPEWSDEEMRHKVQGAAPRCQDRGNLLRVEKTRPARQGRPGPAPAPAAGGPGSQDPPPPGDDDTPQPEDDQGEPAAPSDRPEVPGYEWRKRGLFQVFKGSTSPAGDAVPPKPPVWLAPPFTLPGLVRNEASDGWRLLIAWFDLDGQPHEEPVPFEMMNGEGADVARTLAQGGLVISPEPGARKSLIRYLCRAHSFIPRRVRLVDSLGWNDGAFVLPTGETVGEIGEAVRFSGDVPGARCRATAGTLDGWKDGVARFGGGNPFLAFSIACAFAGPLLALLRPDGGGGFNLQGRSSQGKSTGLVAALSAWGNPLPLPTWRATSNGLEGVAAARNDGFLALDELSQVDAKEAGAVAYMLANGSAKARMTKEGGSRITRQWKLVFLSNGEVTLEDKVTEDGKLIRAKAGQEVRLADIPCPDTGLFAELHGFPGGGELAEHIKAQASRHYGHAIRAYLGNLSEAWPRRGELVTRLKTMEAAWLAKALPSEVDGQVRRVALRFGLVAVGGELARSMGILPWAEGDAASAALVCFKAWLERRGFTGASEVHRGIAAVVAFLERHGMSRFDAWGDKDRTVINRAGTRKPAEGVDGFDFYVTAEGWAEATKGFSASSVARACADAGILEGGSKGKHSKPVSIPGHGKTRCYVIRAFALARVQDAEVA